MKFSVELNSAPKQNTRFSSSLQFEQVNLSHVQEKRDMRELIGEYKDSRTNAAVHDVEVTET